MWKNWKEDREGNYNQSMLCEKKMYLSIKGKINIVLASFAFIILSREDPRMMMHSDPLTLHYH